MAVIDLQAIQNLRSLNPDDNDEFLRELTGIFQGKRVQPRCHSIEIGCGKTGTSLRQGRADWRGGNDRGDQNGIQSGQR